MKIKYLLSLILCFDVFASSEPVIPSGSEHPKVPIDLGVVSFDRYFEVLTTGKLCLPGKDKKPMNITDDMYYKGRIRYVNKKKQEVLRRFEICCRSVFTEDIEYSATAKGKGKREPLCQTEYFLEIEAKTSEGFQAPFCWAVKEAGISIDGLVHQGRKTRAESTIKKKNSELFCLLPTALPKSMLTNSVKTDSVDAKLPEVKTCSWFSIPFVVFMNPLRLDRNRLSGSIFERAMDCPLSFTDITLCTMVSMFVLFSEGWYNVLKTHGINPSEVLNRERLLGLSAGLWDAVLKLPEDYRKVIAAFKYTGVSSRIPYMGSYLYEKEIIFSHIWKLNETTKRYDENELLGVIKQLNDGFDSVYRDNFGALLPCCELSGMTIVNLAQSAVPDLNIVRYFITDTFCHGAFEVDNNGDMQEGCLNLTQFSQLNFHLGRSEHICLTDDESERDSSNSYWKLKPGVSMTDFYKSFVSELKGPNYEILKFAYRGERLTRFSSDPMSVIVAEIKPNEHFCKESVDSMYGYNGKEANAIRLVFVVSKEKSGLDSSKVSTIYPIISHASSLPEKTESDNALEG